MREGDKAIKLFRPKLLVRVIYLVFYGRWHSQYETIQGMRKAQTLRQIANHVATLASKIGRPVFARPFEVVMHSGQPALVLEWIDGHEISKSAASEFQLLLERVLLNAGLPTWSINVHNPGASADMRETSNGLVALDYESAVPPLFVSREEKSLMKARGEWWTIDAVDFGRLENALRQARESQYEDIEAFQAQVNALKSCTTRRVQ